MIKAIVTIDRESRNVIAIGNSVVNIAIVSTVSRQALISGNKFLAKIIKGIHVYQEIKISKNFVLFVSVGVLWPSQQRGHVEPVS